MNLILNTVFQVYCTYSDAEYNRHNEAIDPVAASAEYELEKRVDRMDVFPVEIEKGVYPDQVPKRQNASCKKLCVNKLQLPL